MTTLANAMDKAIVEELVRLKLIHHRLPDRGAVGLRETAGDGLSCDACEEPIDRKQRAVLVMVSLEWLSVRFHVDCYHVWEAERLALAGHDGHAAGR